MKMHNMAVSNGYTGWLHRLEIGDGVEAFYTSRGECVDMNNPYSGFNVCHYTGDDIDNVLSCRSQLAEIFGVPVSSIIVPRQTHSTNVLCVDSLPVNSGALEGVDGVVTKLQGVIIGVSTADCVPVVMCDSVAGVYGVAHAGWRGAVSGIVENTVDVMLKVGADLNRIKAAMGPSICVDCFEVGEEVAEKFPETCVVRKPEWSKPHVNLHRFIAERLVAIGLNKENIAPFSDGICNRCHPDRFFSARALGVNSGRVFTFVKTV